MQKLTHLPRAKKARAEFCTPRAVAKIRLPLWMLQQIQIVARDSGVPAEDVMKIWIAEKLLSRGTPAQAASK